MTSHDADAEPTAETTIGPAAADQTEIVPPDQAPTLAAWSLCDDTEVLQRRRPWPLAAGIAAGCVVGAALLAGAVGLTAWALRPSPSASAGPVTLTEMLPPPPPPVTVTAAPPVTKTWTPAPSTTTVTVQAAPTTVTAEASPPDTTAVRAAPSASPPLSESVYDQRFLDRMQSLGYTVSDRSVALSNAHEVCRLFRLGESPEQVNRQMAAQTGASMTAVLQFTSSAILAYPDCFGHRYSDGD